MEEMYEVKFWFTNDEGYREQSIVAVFLVGDTKNQHHKEEEKIRNNKFFINRDVDVVSVTYC